MGDLFRKEALEARQREALGGVLVISPPGGWAMAMIAVLTITSLIAFLHWGEYARRETVIGHLVPDRGLVEIPMPYSGVLVERLVGEGMRVREGELLFVIAARRSSLDTEDVDLTVLSEIDARLAALDRLATAEATVTASEAQSLQVRIDGATREMRAIEGQIAIQRERLDELEADITRIRALAEAGLLAMQQVRARNDERLLIRTTIQGLERELIGLAARVADFDAQRSLIDAGSERNRAAVDAQAAELRQQSTEIRLRTGTAIRTPIDGTVTAVVSQEGEIVAAGSRLVAIIPDGATLEARLFLPTRAAGFIAPGQEVVLRYSAFPYQRFGVQRGRVLSVPRALAPELSLPRSIIALGPVYELRVSLQSQWISTNEGVFRLRPGLEFEADILLERRPLIRWLLEPIEALADATR